jgi:lipid-binding SYLF domain-containing protein
MNRPGKTFFGLVFALTFAMAMTVANPALAASADDLDRDAMQSLDTLYKVHPVAETLSKSAKGILVFPDIIKAGLVFGGSYGEGVLLKGSAVADYYNSITGS